MRGKDLFKKEFEKNTSNAKSTKGRNIKMLSLRNECLADRYYYYGNYTDKRFDAIIEQLSEEFFLSCETINDIIQDKGPYLRVLKKEQPSLYYFQHKWPHYKWKAT